MAAGNGNDGTGTVAVCFDFDGTLGDTETPAMEVAFWEAAPYIPGLPIGAFCVLWGVLGLGLRGAAAAVSDCCSCGVIYLSLFFFFHLTNDQTTRRRWTPSSRSSSRWVGGRDTAQHKHVPACLHGSGWTQHGVGGRVVPMRRQKRRTMHPSLSHT